MFSEISEEQNMLLGSIQGWLKQNYDGASATVRTNSWELFAEMGWLALPVSTLNDGFGGSSVDVALLGWQFGRHLVTEPYLARIVLAAGLIESCATASLQSAWLPGLIAGTSRWSLALYERSAGYKYAEPTATVNVVDGVSRLSGTKYAIEGADGSTMMIVLARDGQGGSPSLFVVDPRGPGVQIETVSSLDGGYISGASFENCPVQERLDASPDTLGSLRDVIDRGLVFLSAQAVGLMQRAHEDTLEYTKTRRQFGQYLSEFQVLRHRLVDMRVEIEGAESMVESAAKALDAQSGHQLAAAVAKFVTGRAGRFVGQQAVQLHGGMGMTQELAIGRMLKRLLVIDATLGNRDYQLDRVAALLAGGR